MRGMYVFIFVSSESLKHMKVFWKTLVVKVEDELLKEKVSLSKGF